MASSSSDLTIYLNEIGRFPVLTKEAQLLHCRRIHTWVNWEGGRDQAPRSVVRTGKRSMDIMIRTNLKLVVSIARKYNNRGLDLSDLIQEGTLGMIRSLELYDPARGYAFSTYAYWWIRQSTNRAIHMFSRSIRIPVSSHETVASILKFSAHFASTQGRQPTQLELALHLGVTPERIRHILDTHALTACISLDALCSPEGDSFISLRPNDEETVSNSPEVALQEEVRYTMVSEALENLEPMQAEVVKRQYLMRQPVAEVCESMGIPRAKMLTLRQRGLEELRMQLKGRSELVW